MNVLPLPDELIDFARAEIARTRVPGAAVGVLHNSNSYVAGVGVTSVEHPLPVTPQTLFQIGSTSKTFTATAVMQLVEKRYLIEVSFKKLSLVLSIILVLLTKKRKLR